LRFSQKAAKETKGPDKETWLFLCFESLVSGSQIARRRPLSADRHIAPRKSLLSTTEKLGYPFRSWRLDISYAIVRGTLLSPCPRLGASIHPRRADKSVGVTPPRRCEILLIFLGTQFRNT
jgi:hypothetical protein